MESLPDNNSVKMYQRLNEKTFVLGDNADGEDEGETTIDFAHELTQVEEKQFQQISAVRWELKRFRTFYKRYMDNESSDPEERCAIRTFLLHSGDKVARPSTFLINLFTNFAEFNQNEGESSDDIAVDVTIKVLECPREPHLFSSFKVKICSQYEGELCHFYQPIYAAKPKSTVTLSGIFHWGKEKSKLTEDETLFVFVEHYMFRHPMEWGLSSKAVDMLVKLMCSHEIDVQKKTILQEIIDKSEELRVTGVIDCLKRIK